MGNVLHCVHGLQHLIPYQVRYCSQTFISQMYSLNNTCIKKQGLIFKIIRLQYIDDDLKTVQSDKLLDKHGFYVLSKLFTQVNRRNKLYESDFLMKIFSRLIPINAGQN